MAAPEFIICPPGDGFKVYPSGVIVLAAADWLGSSGATTESDAGSCCGTVVRETQEAAGAPLTDSHYNSASDTLTIPLGDLPLEDALTRYTVYASIKIEGDWSPTNGQTSKSSDNDRFDLNTCRLSMHGDLAFPSSSNPGDITYQPRGTPDYRIANMGFSISGLQRPNLGTAWSTYTWHWRALRAAGTSIEYLIDQIYLFPSHSPGTANGWVTSDFKVVPGYWGTFENVYTLDPDDEYETGQHWIDGADGGDDNGKFTWHPYPGDPFNEPLGGIGGGNGGGDYQKEDNEYMERLVGYLNVGGNEYSDFLLLRNSDTGEEGRADCYGLHGPYFRSQEVFIEEPFSQTFGDHNYSVADNHFVGTEWGLSPEGFRYLCRASPLILGAEGPFAFEAHTHGTAFFMDGSRGGFIGIYGLDEVRQPSVGLLTHPSNGGASVRCDNLKVYGEFSIESVNETGLAGDTTPHSPVVLLIKTAPQTSTTFSGGQYEIALRFDLDGLAEWSLWELGQALAGTPLINWTDISSWWTFNTEVGFRIEVHRFMLRVKFWELSGGEPGSWDYEDFRDLRRTSSAASNDAYDYDDNLNYSILESEIQTFTIAINPSNHRSAGEFIVWLDNLHVEYDPVGSNENVWASIEKPEANEVSRIEIPATCQHWVNWGRRIWTEQYAGDPTDPFLDFSAKVWNDPSAAELQRSEAVLYWLRSIHGHGPIDLSKIRYRAYALGD